MNFQLLIRNYCLFRKKTDAKIYKCNRTCKEKTILSVIGSGSQYLKYFKDTKKKVLDAKI